MGMMFNLGKARYQDDLRTLRIEIPAKRRWLSFIFLSIWMTGWFFGEIIVSVLVFGNLIGYFFDTSFGDIEGGVFSSTYFLLVFWLLAWTFAGIFVYKKWVWMFKGKEIIEVTKNQLSIEKKLALFVPKKIYKISEVFNLQINYSNYGIPMLGDSANSSLFGDTRTGLLRFEYRLSTVSFGKNLSEDEARQFLDMINQKINQ